MLDLIWSRPGLGLVVVVALAAVFADLSASFTPRGPVTTAQAYASLAVALVVGLTAGVAFPSRWVLLLVPVAYTVLFELGRMGHVGASIDAPSFGSILETIAFFVGRGTPDGAQLGNTWISEFAALEALEPLGPWVERSAGVDSAAYFSGIWDTNEIDGTLYGVPWYVDTRVLFYRRDILAQVADCRVAVVQLRPGVDRAGPQRQGEHDGDGQQQPEAQPGGITRLPGHGLGALFRSCW